MELTKTCRECSRILPLDQFHIHNGCKDGRQTKCRECVKTYRTKYYEKNRPALIEYSKKYYAVNTEQTLEYQKRYGAKNKAKIATRYKKWRAENRDNYLAGKKVYYVANRDKLAEFFKAYRKKHPEYGRISTITRRAKIAQAPGHCSGKQWLAKCEYFGWRCYLCHTPLTLKTLETEHRKPISRGGSNWPANLAPACSKCNQAKGQKTEAEFLAENR